MNRTPVLCLFVDLLKLEANVWVGKDSSLKLMQSL